MVGAPAPYDLLMREHKIFKEIFSDDQRLADAFAKLFVVSPATSEKSGYAVKKSAKRAFGHKSSAR